MRERPAPGRAGRGAGVQTYLAPTTLVPPTTSTNTGLL